MISLYFSLDIVEALPLYLFFFCSVARCESIFEKTYSCGVMNAGVQLHSLTVISLQKKCDSAYPSEDTESNKAYYHHYHVSSHDFLKRNDEFPSLTYILDDEFRKWKIPLKNLSF